MVALKGDYPCAHQQIDEGIRGHAEIFFPLWHSVLRFVVVLQVLFQSIQVGLKMGSQFLELLLVADAIEHHFGRDEL